MKMKLLNKQDINKLRLDIKTMYTNKYFNMFMDSYIYTGPDPEQSDWLMKQFWAVGTAAAFKIKNTDMIGLVPYAVQTYNMYDYPEEIVYVNKRNVKFIPAGVHIVNKDCAIGWIQANHKPVRQIVDYYIDRLTSIEMVINTRLTLEKCPWMVAVDPSDEAKAEDLIDRILNDEVVVFISFEQLHAVQALTTNAPYILDKIYSLKVSYENELLTYLGLDNNGGSSNPKEQKMLVDEVNANNQAINANKDAYLKHISEFLEKINELFGVNWTVEPAQKPVESVHEEGVGEDEGSEYDKEEEGK